MFLSAAYAAILALVAVQSLRADQPRATSLREQVASAGCIVHARVVSYESVV